MGKNNGLTTPCVATVTGSGVRVRSAPVTGDVYYSAAQKDSMYVFEKKDNQSDGYCWYKVANRTQTGKKEGYIRGDYLSGSSGGSSSGGGTSTGATGSGPNLNVTLDDIHDGKGSWKQDTKTTHPQIKLMQQKLNEKAALRGATGCGSPDGIFGPATKTCVEWYQKYPFWKGEVYWGDIGQDGIVGQKTIKKLVADVGRFW